MARNFKASLDKRKIFSEGNKKNVIGRKWNYIHAIVENSKENIEYIWNTALTVLASIIQWKKYTELLVQYFSLISLSYNQSIWKNGFGNFQVIHVFERKCPQVKASQQQLKPTEEIQRWIWETRHWYFLSRFTLFCLPPLYQPTCNKLLLAATSNSTLRGNLYQSFCIYCILIQRSLWHPDSLETLMTDSTFLWNHITKILVLADVENIWNNKMNPWLN